MESQRPPRILAVDLFRGLMVMAMMMVDWPGNWDTRCASFNHAEWVDITTADFIFPSFLFIMGAAMPLLPGGAEGPEREALGAHPAPRRLLFLLGYVLNICWDASPAV